MMINALIAAILVVTNSNGSVSTTFSKRDYDEARAAASNMVEEVGVDKYLTFLEYIEYLNKADKKVAKYENVIASYQYEIAKLNKRVKECNKAITKLRKELISSNSSSSYWYNQAKDAETRLSEAETPIIYQPPDVVVENYYTEERCDPPPPPRETALDRLNQRRHERFIQIRHEQEERNRRRKR